MAETTPRKHPAEHLAGYAWKPGQSGNPNGRGKGSRNKLGEAFLDALHDDFQAHGVAAIQKVRDEKPDQYLKVIASILPKELNVKVDPFDDLTDEQLDRRIRQLAAALELSVEDGTGAVAGGEEAPLRH